MNSDEDPDWEAEAAKAEFLERAAAAHEAIRKSHELDLSKNLPSETKIWITISHEGPEQDYQIEFTILDPGRQKVLVQDPVNLSQPTVGTLIGCEDVEATTPGTYFPSKRVLLHGKLKRHCWVVYEASGRTIKTYPDSILRIKVRKPGMPDPYSLWDDE